MRLSSLIWENQESQIDSWKPSREIGKINNCSNVTSTKYLRFCLCLKKKWNLGILFFVVRSRRALEIEHGTFEAYGLIEMITTMIGFLGLLRRSTTKMVLSSLILVDG